MGREGLYIAQEFRLRFVDKTHITTAPRGITSDASATFRFIFNNGPPSNADSTTTHGSPASPDRPTATSAKGGTLPSRGARGRSRRHGSHPSHHDVVDRPVRAADHDRVWTFVADHERHSHVHALGRRDRRQVRAPARRRDILVCDDLATTPRLSTARTPSKFVQRTLLEHRNGPRDAHVHGRHDGAEHRVIDWGPSGTTSNSSPLLGFSSEAWATFECQLDGVARGSLARAHTPSAIWPTAPTRSRSARSMRRATRDETPAARTFTVDTTAPQTAIDWFLPGTTRNSSPLLGFSSEAGATLNANWTLAPGRDAVPRAASERFG